MSADKIDKPWLFQPGQSGNPAGRRKGSRSVLSEAFIKALADDFETHGLATIERVRAEKPESYLGVIGKLMPKLLELSGVDGEDIKMSGVVSFVGTKPE